MANRISSDIFAEIAPKNAAGVVLPFNMVDYEDYNRPEWMEVIAFDRDTIWTAANILAIDGQITAWGDVVADEDLDLIVHLGDYIYESGLQGDVRAHDVAEVVTLDQYRNRYALYRSDPMLRAAHATAPWLITCVFRT